MLIERVPHTNTYVTIEEGIRIAVFYTKLEARLLRPLLDVHGATGACRSRNRAPDDRAGRLGLRHQRAPWSCRVKPVTASSVLPPEQS